MEDWSDLPELVIIDICKHLPNYYSLASFRSVCKNYASCIPIPPWLFNMLKNKKFSGMLFDYSNGVCEEWHLRRIIRILGINIDSISAAPLSALPIITQIYGAEALNRIDIITFGNRCKTLEPNKILYWVNLLHKKISNYHIINIMFIFIGKKYFDDALKCKNFIKRNEWNDYSLWNALYAHGKDFDETQMEWIYDNFPRDLQISLEFSKDDFYLTNISAIVYILEKFQNRLNICSISLLHYIFIYKEYDHLLYDKFIDADDNDIMINNTRSIINVIHQRWEKYDIPLEERTEFIDKFINHCGDVIDLQEQIFESLLSNNASIELLKIVCTNENNKVIRALACAKQIKFEYYRDVVKYIIGYELFEKFISEREYNDDQIWIRIQCKFIQPHFIENAFNLLKCELKLLTRYCVNTKCLQKIKSLGLTIEDYVQELEYPGIPTYNISRIFGKIPIDKTEKILTLRPGFFNVIHLDNFEDLLSFTYDNKSFINELLHRLADSYFYFQGILKLLCLSRWSINDINPDIILQILTKNRYPFHRLLTLFFIYYEKKDVASYFMRHDALYEYCKINFLLIDTSSEDLEWSITSLYMYMEEHDML